MYWDCISGTYVDEFLRHLDFSLVRYIDDI